VLSDNGNISTAITESNSPAICQSISSPHTLRVMKKGNLSETDRAAAKRLRNLWDVKKRALHLTQEKAAAILGFSTQGAVSQFLNGTTRLNTDATLGFAKLLQVAPEEIRPELDLGPAPPTLLAAASPSSAESIDVPMFNAVASMGLGRSLPEYETVIDTLRLSKQWVHSHLSNISSPSNLAALSAYGDSMAPTFSDGDILIVDRGVSDIRIDAVYVLSLNGELYIKRIQRRITDGAILIKSDNALYDPVIVTNGERENLQVLGRVVWAWNGRKL
jgi:phage repressor protein C with HTH and peptisase S24 domain